ncbi:hypothetical protein ATANTOWER_027141 [Ataeniobius toweri]|uniref:Uncharacterized protein n=1 Tax=Ataeniobius toweri TaxID=208326 RepID=A0ABU7CCZ1_9TELE|nr:hypothetical protein [Ataeniobius toweri]
MKDGSLCPPTNCTLPRDAAPVVVLSDRGKTAPLCFVETASLQGTLEHSLLLQASERNKETLACCPPYPVPLEAVWKRQDVARAVLLFGQ